MAIRFNLKLQEAERTFLEKFLHAPWFAGVRADHDNERLMVRVRNWKDYPSDLSAGWENFPVYPHLGDAAEKS